MKKNREIMEKAVTTTPKALRVQYRLGVLCVR